MLLLVCCSLTMEYTMWHPLKRPCQNDLEKLSGSEVTVYGHLVLHLMAGFVLLYTSRVIFKGRVTMEAMVFNVKHA